MKKSAKRSPAVILLELCESMNKMLPMLPAMPILRALVTEGIQSAKQFQKARKAAVKASVASGRSGRPRQHDEAKRREIAEAHGTLAEIAKRFGVGTTAVGEYRKEFR